MLYNLIYALALVLILSGLFFLFYLLINKMLLGSKTDEFFTIVIGEDNENLPQTVYAAYIQCNILNYGKKNKVYIIDKGISQELKEKCYQIVCHSDNIRFFSEDDFKEIYNNCNKA